MAKKNSKTWADRTTGRRDIEAAVAERLGLPQVRVADVLCEALNEIADALAKGNRVELRRFGVLFPKPLAGKRIHAIHTGGEIEVPPRLSIGFKPAPGLVERVRSDEGEAA